jgi:hypothetical protein
VRVVEQGKPEQALAFDVRTQADRALALQQALRFEGLARAGQSMGDHKARRRGPGPGDRRVQIAARVLAAGAGAQQRDLRADQCAIDDGEAQRWQSAVVTGAIQPAIEKPEREIGSFAGAEVHDCERDVVDHIDPAQRRVEFDAIERRHMAFDADDIFQVQVAMALAHVAAGQALFPAGRECSAL